MLDSHMDYNERDLKARVRYNINTNGTQTCTSELRVSDLCAT